MFWLPPPAAAADLPQPKDQAGQEEHQAAQQHREREDQDQYEGGRQVEGVLVRREGVVPAEEEHVEGGHGQGAVTQTGLQGVTEGLLVIEQLLML